MTTEQVRQLGLGRDIIQELLASLQRMRMKEVQDTEVELLADTGNIGTAQLIQVNGRTFKNVTDSSSLATTSGDAADAAWQELKAAATAAGMSSDDLARYVKQATQQIQQSSTTTKASGNGYSLGNFGLSTDDMFRGVQQSLQRTGGRGYNNH